MARYLTALLFVSACSAPEPREIVVDVWLEATSYCESRSPDIWSTVRSVEVGIGEDDGLQFLEPPLCVAVTPSGDEVTGFDIGATLWAHAPEFPTPTADRSYRLLGGGFDSDNCAIETMTVCAVSSSFGPGHGSEWKEDDPVWMYLLCSSPADPCPDPAVCEEDDRFCMDGVCRDYSSEPFPDATWPYDQCRAALNAATEP